MTSVSPVPEGFNTVSPHIVVTDGYAAIEFLKSAFGAEQVFCMECGKGFTTLKKHLSVSHNLTPKDYRKKFKVPAKTPLVARNYSESKKRIAQKLGLAEKLAEGRKRRAKK